MLGAIHFPVLRIESSVPRPLSSGPMQPSFGARQWAGVFLGPVLFVAAGLGLRPTGLNSAACWAAATVFLMATWWITEPLPLWVTACLPLVLFPAFGSVSFKDVALQYFDPVNFLFLGGMMIAASACGSLVYDRIESVE